METPSVAAEETATPQHTPEQLQKLAQTGQLFTLLAQDPKYRDQVLGLVAEANPNVYIPEIALPKEVDKKVSERVKPHEDKVSELSKTVDELKGFIARREWGAKTGLTDDEVIEVDTLAKEAGITKAETALEHWQMKQRLGTPRATPATRASEEYVQKLRKINPRDPSAGARLKNLAIEEGQRIMRETRGRRAG